MSEYKRKKVSKFSNKKAPKIKKSSLNDDRIFDEITDDDFSEYYEAAKPKKQSKKASKALNKQNKADNTDKKNLFDDFKVITPSVKEASKSVWFKVFLAVLCIAVIIALLSFLLPTGIIEGVTNLSALIGKGDYPIAYNGSLVKDVVPQGSAYFVLNDTSVSAYSSSGKEIFTEIHGFSNPMLSVSDSRAVVFDQNSHTLNVYNLSGLIRSVTTENNIINASICRNGSYVISTVGDEYTSTVSVYNKNGKKLYTWNSAKEIINNAVLSSNGKKLAVSCVQISGGMSVSKLYVLEYSSANPVFTYDFGDKIVLGIRSTSGGFGCITENYCSFFTWRKYEHKDYKVDDKSLSLCRTNGNSTILVFSRESDRTDNRLIVLSSSGDSKGEFDFKGVITDVAVKGGRVFFLSDTATFIYDADDGELLQKGSCDYGCKRIAAISSDKMAAVTDDSIIEIAVE